MKPKIALSFIFFTLIYFGYQSKVAAQKIADSISIDSANHCLARTLNIALTLDAPKEGAWGHSLKAEEFKLIKDAGFTGIRLAIQWVAHMDSVAPYKIDPQFLKRVDWAVEQCRKNHMTIVLDNHLDAQLMKDPAKYRDRFLSLWQQLAVHYRNYPPTVMFEVMAEPNGKLSALWNDYFTDALAIIRRNNPTRPVIVGSSLYNMAYALYSLRLPAEDNFLIVTIHYYQPINFTMQGETWFPMGDPKKWIGTQWLGTDQEKMSISTAMDNVAAWAAKNKRPIFWGEFGAGDTADVASKVRYFTFIREQAEANHFSWGFFNFCVRFSLYDIRKQQWHEELLHALIPNSPSK
jgi:endoglucanase